MTPSSTDELSGNIAAVLIQSAALGTELHKSQTTCSEGEHVPELTEVVVPHYHVRRGYCVILDKHFEKKLCHAIHKHFGETVANKLNQLSK
jgi:hypothetical protein